MKTYRAPNYLICSFSSLLALLAAVLQCCKSNKAIGTQSIPTKLFKTFNKTLSEPLTNLKNLSFIKGVFPNVLKTAQILPTFKNGGKTEINNYRPISLTMSVRY